MRVIALLLLLLLSINLAATALAINPHGTNEGEVVRARFIVEGPNLELAKSTIESMGGKVIGEFEVLGGLVFEGSLGIAERLSSLGYRVALERTYELMEPLPFEVEAIVNSAVPGIGALFAQSVGFNGTGVRVAIVDTGIENSHPWLIRGGASVVKWEVSVAGGVVTDYCGRGSAIARASGTHVAGIIASQNKSYPGVAPGVDLYDIIATAPVNDCRRTSTFALSSALERALTGPDGRRDTGDEADVIVMGFGHVIKPELAYLYKSGRAWEFFIGALERAAKEKLIVTGVGDGRGMNHYNLFCLARGVVCVGAINHRNTTDTSDDTLASFSSKGPAFPGMMVPHLVAPGVAIYSSVPRELGTARTFSNTSVAAPFVAGAAAILIQQLRQQGASIAPGEVLAALMQTAKDVRPHSSEMPDLFYQRITRSPYVGMDFLERYVGSPPIITVADQGAGQVDIRAALQREISMVHGNLSFAHLYGNSGEVEITVTNLINSPLTLAIQVVAAEVYTFKNVSSRFIAPKEISLSPRGSTTLKVSFRDLEPGTYGGYVLLRSSSSLYRFPLLVTSPLRLNAESLKLMKMLNSSLGTRNGFHDSVMIFIEAEEQLSDPFYISLTASAGSGPASFAHFTIASPSVDFTHNPYSYLFSQRGSYLLTVSIFYHPYSVIGAPFNTTLSLVISGNLLVTLVQRALESVKSVEARVNALESALRNINATISELRNLLESLRRELNAETEERRREVSRVNNTIIREGEERRREISRLNQTIAALLSSTRNVEEGLRTARTDLAGFSERLVRANSTLAAAIRTQSERVSKLEGEARTLRQALNSLLQELESLKAKMLGREREVRGGFDITMLLSMAAIAMAVVSLAISAVVFLRKR